jgi:KaiC/GvpD/RAD55 family RecA-like ATPase
MAETLETGIEVLDRKLDGGIPAGRVVVLSASPASQSELFLYEMAAIRPTVYLTTERTVADVDKYLKRTAIDADEVDIRRIGSEAPLSEARAAIEELPDRATVIVDPIRLLESTDSERYRAFVNDLKARIAEVDGLALLHCLEGRDVPPQRDRTEYLADIIFSLSTEIRGGTLQNDLSPFYFSYPM